MHVHTGDGWSSGYLDATPAEGWVRVHVHRQVALVAVDDQYFVRGAQLAMVASYLRMLGPRRVLRKVRSRQRESVRNDAWLTVGVGRTDEGATVAFVSPSGPRASERVLIPDVLVVPVDEHGSDAAEAPAHHVRRSPDGLPLGLEQVLIDEVIALAGWRPEQGVAAALGPAAAGAIAALAAAPPPSTFSALGLRPPDSEVTEVVEASASPTDRPSFTLFGYGQYAKTQVIPNLGQHLHLERVHELDPLQIGPVGAGGVGEGLSWDTSGRPRPDEVIERAVVAGYHHTHAPLAAELIERGARHVVIEKPIASSPAELEQLLSAVERHGDARLHIAFQRRHSPFNRLLVDDLGGGPISMAATVYEVPLPARHWYRWPVVGNAVVSNGCHWIDHFLFLNRYAPVRHLEGHRLATQLVLALELDNGASGLISLRHEGSPRRGVRDLCQFWHDDATVTIEDLRRYRAERGRGPVRHRTTHPYRALEEMYQEFGRRIAEDRPGDPIGEIRASAEATLELARLVEQR